MKAHICFIGKVGLRYRWSAVRWMLRGLWLAFCGYQPTIHMVPETAEDAHYLASQRATEEASQAPGSISVN